MNKIIHYKYKTQEALRQKLSEVIYSEKSSANIRRLAEYVLNHFEPTAFLTASELAEKASTSQSTVTRFVTIVLEYESYSAFVKEIQNIIRQQISGGVQSTVVPEGTNDYERYLQAEQANLNKAFESVSQEKLKRLAKLVATKESITIFGFRSANHIATYFYFLLSKLHSNVKVCTSGSSEVYDVLSRVDKEKHLAINFVFPRYPREMIELIQYMKKEKYEMLTISDSYSLEQWGMTECQLVLPVQTETLFESYAASYSVLNLFLDEIGKVNLQFTKERLYTLERLYQDQHMFYTK